MSKNKVLIKYGGNAMQSESLKNEIAQKIKVLHESGFEVLLVHGGGPFINKALELAGIESQFFDGQRHTSAEALVHIERALKGEVNSSLVGLLNNSGLKAVGLSGKDGKLAIAEKRWHTPIAGGEKIDLGQVGDVKSIDTELPERLLKAGYIPVLTCIASDDEGNDYNINADMFAGHMAAALGVDEYILLTDVDGLFENFPDPQSILHTMQLDDIEKMYGNIITGGMIPKLESCEIAIKGGAARATILNGTQPDQITDYLLHKKSIGTTIHK
ncbi:acetylglutamate kinase [Fulvivirga sediminis]|uniref:Acetylglutamate kinase n=1 Tax=Fulvivirga sediminis TaxID=2803949 RepID=A0A937K230_9BACT|nr:acetylglutamate kinase [Fulvivirga sediminis]MBL3657940.1 acetylglutamate kinase [Fulvivirga sediminis]